MQAHLRQQQLQGKQVVQKLEAEVQKRDEELFNLKVRLSE